MLFHIIGMDQQLKSFLPTIFQKILEVAELSHQRIPIEINSHNVFLGIYLLINVSYHLF